MAIDREKSFWLSYSDLMTSLFFIMLVLFIVSISIVFSQKKIVDELTKKKLSITELSKENDSLRIQVKNLTNELGELKVTTEQYENILQLEEQFKTLSNSSRLRYDEDHKTFVAKDFEGIEIFNPEKHTIKVEYLETVDKIGRDLEQLLKLLHKNNPNNQFLLVIEGNSANNYKKSMPKDKLYNYRLSYDRALELYTRWKWKGIDLRKYNTEIQICGSGLNGINRDDKVEENNKRFVIQIIPKISRPK